MKYLTLAVIILLAAAWPVNAQQLDELEPASSVFSTFVDYDLHLMYLRSALIGGNPWDKEALMVANPTFDPPWAVYLAGGDQPGPPFLVYSVMTPDYHEKYHHHIKNPAFVYALFDPHQKLVDYKELGARREVMRLQEETADLLRRVWTAMLNRARYPDRSWFGLDGIRYWFGHFIAGKGVRSGTIWSPDAGTKLHALIKLAEQMRRLVLAPAAQRKAIEKSLQDAARSLLDRIAASHS